MYSVSDVAVAILKVRKLESLSYTQGGRGWWRGPKKQDFQQEVGVHVPCETKGFAVVLCLRLLHDAIPVFMSLFF